MNKYDVEHVVTAHPKMTREQWEGIYRQAWRLYYTDEHIERLLRRAAATGMSVSSTAAMIFAFSSIIEIEGIHPLQAGIIRVKHRTDRRPGLPIEPAWRFYPRLFTENLRKLRKYHKYWKRVDRLRHSIRKDPNRFNYWDPALAPPEAADTETMALFTHNEGARAAVQHAHKIKQLTGSKESRAAAL